MGAGRANAALVQAVVEHCRQLGLLASYLCLGLCAGACVSRRSLFLSKRPFAALGFPLSVHRQMAKQVHLRVE